MEHPNFDHEFLKRVRERMDNHFFSSEVLKIWDPVLVSCAKYCLVGAGKAVRPGICWWAYSSLANENNATKATESDLAEISLALEFVHTYSLIHDDLPSMDNDDFRRGKPTLHRTHTEAHAVLTGDALLTGAFELLFNTQLESKVQVALGRVLSRAAGGAGMIAGQMRDIEKRGSDFSDVLLIHKLKTGCLFGASFAFGALAAGIESESKISSLVEWGEELGIIFQLKDDLLDATAGATDLGKTAGKDLIQDKLSALKFMAPEKLENEISLRSKNLMQKGSELFSSHAQIGTLVKYFVDRKN